MAPSETAKDMPSLRRVPRYSAAKARTIATRIITSLFGLVCAAYGLIAAVSPLPAGAPLVIVGVLLIALANPRARPLVRRLRRRIPLFDRLVRAFAPHAGRDLKALVDETDPASP